MTRSFYKENVLKKKISGLFVTIGFLATVSAAAPSKVATMTNDGKNTVVVYDIGTKKAVRTIDAKGAGGAGGNAWGLAQSSDGEWLAAVNGQGKTVTLVHGSIVTVLATASAPASVAFGPNPKNPTQMYVAGGMTVQSFKLGNHASGYGSTSPSGLVVNLNPADGSTAMVGMYDQNHVAVSLKTAGPGVLDIIALGADGEIEGPVAAHAAPAGTLTLFSFVQTALGNLFVQFAHSSQWGGFVAGSFQTPVAAPVAADCWATTLQGSSATKLGSLPMIFTANTASKNLSTLVLLPSGAVSVLATTAIATGGAPADIVGRKGYVAVLDHVSNPAAGQAPANISVFSVNANGTLSPVSVIPISAPAANGIALID